MSIESIGKSHEGRDIWVLTVTNARPARRPRSPRSGSTATSTRPRSPRRSRRSTSCRRCVTQYGNDADVTRALDTRAFYVCPRINPDGAEWALADKPKWIRSSTRPYPCDEDELDGLTVEDVDGDGRILQMRIPDSNGLWKEHPDEPGLMIRRDPTETGGTYYRIMPEGTSRTTTASRYASRSPSRDSISTATFRRTGGRSSSSSARGRIRRRSPRCARSSFFVGHPNITGGIAFHTWSGVLLRPFEHLPDDEMHAEDLWVYRRAGDKGTELTGYPDISVYHEFRYHPKEVIGGTFDWIYEHLGMFSWVVEIWSPMREAGITNYKYIDWFRDHPIEDDLKLIAGATRSRAASRTSRGSRSIIRSSAASRSAAGTASTRSPIRRRRSSSASSRASRSGSSGRRSSRRSSSSFPPRPKRSATSTGASRSSCRTRAGCRRTCRSARWSARSCAASSPRSRLPAGATLVQGKRRDEHGQLEGRAYKHTGVSFWPDYNVTDDRVKVEWVVRGNKGDEVSVTRGTSARAPCAPA